MANINMDMVGEDTVKTNSRFYFTQTPDSVPGFVDALMADVLEQTREANLYAATGTRNYWMPEAIPYAQGSDHDVFLGLGIPSTMLGHDPDWTHHTSEDKMDKTDASEFQRVGTMASAAAYWIATSASKPSIQIDLVEHADRAAELAHRLASDASAKDRGAEQRTKLNDSAFFEENSKVSRAVGNRFVEQIEPRASLSKGPHRLTLLPLDPSAFDGVSPEDAKWLAEQEARFSSDSEGLATKPNFALIGFEAVNFMDGHRTTAEIANLLSAEYLLDIEQAWVDHLVSILEKQKLVAAN